MRSEKLGSLQCKIVGGTDGNGGGDGPVVVLLHGYGAPGEDLVPLWRVIDAPKGTRWVFPAAPIALTGYGLMSDSRAWWDIDLPKLMAERMAGKSDSLAKLVPDGLHEAREKVVATLEAVRTTLGVSNEKLILGGFSQGAMLSCDTVLRSRIPFAGLVLMSGTFVAENELRKCMSAPDAVRVPVFQSHGTHDPILPFSEAERLQKAFIEHKWSTEFHSFRGQHEIPMPVLNSLSRFISARF